MRESPLRDDQQLYVNLPRRSPPQPRLYDPLAVRGDVAAAQILRTKDTKEGLFQEGGSEVSLAETWRH